MSGLENYNEEAVQIEHEMVVKGYALDIDWSDEAQLRALAREALTHGRAPRDPAANRNNVVDRAKVDFFGLVQLMLKVMQNSAGVGFHTHGGPVWKAFGKALWDEAESLGLVGNSGR